MPTPDLTGYVDLSPYDVDASTLIDRALAAATAKLPGWVPREGNTEVVLIEALAQEVMELVYALNRVPSAVAMILLGLFDVDRDDGSPPTATVTVTAVDNAGYTIPAGTVFRLDGDPAILFASDADVVIAPGSTSGVVAVTGTTNTDEANGTAAGTALDIISSLYFAELAELATPVADGSNPEDDVAWLDRGMARLSRLTTTLVLPDHFTAAALEEADVARATTIDLYDGAGAFTGTDYGHVTVAVLGDNAALLSGARKTAIEAVLEDLALANLDVHVIDPTITAVPVTVTVVREATYTNAEVTANITNALDQYLNPELWEWEGTVRRNELIALIDGVEGVSYVDTLAAPAADVVLTGVAPLADLGAVAITVNAP